MSQEEGRTFRQMENSIMLTPAYITASLKHIHSFNQQSLDIYYVLTTIPGAWESPVNRTGNAGFVVPKERRPSESTSNPGRGPAA